MSSSTRDSLVSIQRFASGKDSYGGVVKTWAELRKEWARVTYGAAAERRNAAQQQSSQAATFDLPDNELTRSLKAVDRIVWNGIDWDLAGPGVPKSAGELQFTATGAS